MNRYEKRLYVLDDILSQIHAMPWWHHHKGEMHNVMGDIALVRRYYEGKLD